MNKKMLLTCLLFGISVLFLTGCQSAKPAPVAPAAPTPPAAPAPTPPPAAPAQPTNTGANLPANPSALMQNPVNGRVVSIENNIYFIEVLELEKVFTGENAPLQKAEYDALSEDEKKAYITKRNELVKTAPKAIKKVEMGSDTSYIIPEVTGQRDANGNMIRTMNTGSLSDIIVNSYINVQGELVNDTVKAIRVLIQIPRAQEGPSS